MARADLAARPSACVRRALSRRCGRGHARSLERPVDGRARHAEEFGEFAAGVLSGVMEGDEVLFLAWCELGLLATEAALGLGDLHAFARACAYEVGFELGDH